MNYTVAEKCIRKTGEVIFRNKWYYSRFDEALIKILRLTEKDELESAADLRQAIDVIKTVYGQAADLVSRAVDQAGIPEADADD